ncbi:sorbosone dehydrogenase family protein [Catellatospora sp. IY07-71]|uniref:PQQ-dependent sugar dehydrogenase n=1 Tax=Catellatospora sp. IY07-71 TaxID=2728827 RepID=UPI001BB37A77|nr:PQQ-dependent sugar dehydrogenase [Catellatospora sp. IY07-71]
MSGILTMAVSGLPAEAAPPSAPVITEPGADNTLVSAADVHMESAPFSDPDGDQHLCSEWEITTGGERVWASGCTGGVLRYHIHLGDGVFENSHTGRKDLVPDKDYQLRVRYRASSGDDEWSDWSERPFRTAKEKQPLPDAPQWLVKQAGYKVEEVAGGFQLPVNIAMAPGHALDAAKPLFYVTELYGKIKVVKGDYSVGTYEDDLLNFDPTGAFPGSGEMGVTGLVVEPATGDVFASMVYKDGGNFYPKVVRFHSTDGGKTAASKKTILDLDDEPQSASHQISNLSIGPDGKLYVHMGDGMEPARAQDMNSYRGKILRMNLDGSAPSDNPFYKASDGIDSHDYIFASGFRNPFGGAWRAADKQLYEVENGGGANDRFARVTRGTDYGWDGDVGDTKKNALYTWEDTVAPVNIAFTEPSVHHASGFPEDKYGHGFVTTSGPTYATGPQDDGKRIVDFGFNADGSVTAPKTLVEYNGSGKTTVAGIAAGPDGLYFSGLYADSGTDPTKSGAKIYRVRYAPTKSTSGVTIYGDRDFKGSFQALGAGVHDASKGGLGSVGGDKMSSLKVGPGYRVVICQDDSAAGRTNALNLGLCRYYGPGQHQYVGADLNDKTSLITVMGAAAKNGSGVTAYRDADFEGADQPLGVGGYEVSAGELPDVDDATSSLKIDPGYQAVVCQHDRAAGVNSGQVGPCRFYAAGEHVTLGDSFSDNIHLIAVGGPAVTMFSEAGLQGNRQAYTPGIYEAVRGQFSVVGNDAITSFRVEAGYRVLICNNDSKFAKNKGDLGPCRQYREGVHNLQGTPVDNTASLITVLAGPSNGARMTVYRDRDFKGVSNKYGIGVYGATELGPVGNDKISSLKVAADHRAVVCRHDHTKPDVNVSPCRYYAAGEHKYTGADLNDDISLVAVAK